MEEMFTKKIVSDCLEYSSTALNKIGLKHGFAGIGAVEMLTDVYGAIFRLHQAHTANVVDLRGADLEPKHYFAMAEKDYKKLPPTDAMILSRELNYKMLFAVATADCLPLIFADDNQVALIHAGWRGFASGIIQKVINMLSVNSSNLVAVIGPAAGGDRYQVGKEVISCMPQGAVYRADSQDGKFLLDLPASAVNVISQVLPEIDVVKLPVCTISDLDFHSYRRENKLNGHNFSYVVL